MSQRRRSLVGAVGMLAFAVLSDPIRAQGSTHALRFSGGSPAGSDRVSIVVDDDSAGAASTAADIGVAGFTIEFWIRGDAVSNATVGGAGDTEYPTQNWKSGNVLVDREVVGPSGAEFGIGVAGGRIRFGTGAGASAPLDSDHTLEGSTWVLDGTWHHVACVRDSSSGIKRIYVDGALDHQSAPVSFADLSYPDLGGLAGGAPAKLTLAADGADSGAPDFSGELDELRLWSKALTRSQILSRFDRVMPSAPSGLAAWYRFEEGAGTSATPTASPGAPSAQVVSGIAGSAEWTDFAVSPSSCAPVSTGVLPPGFLRTVITEALEQPTALAFLPDGRILIAERQGRIRLVANGVLVPSPVMTLPVDIALGERGVLGLTVHPQFATNGWFYVFHTTPEPRDRVSRFTFTGTTATVASELVVWQAPTLAPAFHHAGGLGFDATGRLLIAVGDQLDSANAQDLGKPFGKLLRIGDDGTIPPDNPFVGVAGVAPEIFASGFRNPFRFSVDINGTIYLGDVGGNTTLSAEEANRVVAGANYGWPKQEGANCFVGDCSNTTFPFWSYQHFDPDQFLIQPQGSITMGPRYRGDVFPAAYRENLFVADYANRSIRRLILDDLGDVLADPVFLWPGFGRTIVDLALGPDGALWYLAYGATYAGIPDQAGLVRIAWGGGANAAPVAVASATPSTGAAPLLVSFSSAGSLDPDVAPAPLSFSWAFGDGTFSNAPNPSHVYLANGEYVAQLTVSDGENSASSPPILVEVGAKPIVALNAPVNGASYVAGETITFSGVATDLEDGVLPATALSFDVALVHAQHEHPFLGPITGVNGGSFVVPVTGHSPADTHFVVRLFATDSDGLSASTSIAVFPDPSALAIATLPPGIALELDEEPVLSPLVTPSVDGFHHQVVAPATATIGSGTYTFRCWSDGGAAAHEVPAPGGGLNLTAVYDSVIPNESTVSIASANRNAQYQLSTGVVLGSLSDPSALRVGRDGSGGIETGFSFVSTIPRGAVVLDAFLQLKGASGGDGQPACIVRAFDVADAPAFAAGSAISLASIAPLTTASLIWTVPSIALGQTVESPNLAALVQEVVDRPDYAPGGFVGFVLNGSLNTLAHYAVVRNFASSDPPRLRVRWVTPNPTGGCVPPCGFSTIVPPIKPANRLALVGGGSTSLGGVATIEASGLGAAGTAIVFVSTHPGSTSFLGGTLLVGFGGFFSVLSLPAISGSTLLPIPITNDPGVAGFSLYFQVAAADAAQSSGVAFSNGLKFTICP